MRVTRSHGPFSERPYYTDSAIESIVADELRMVNLLPSSPSPIRVERFVEKRFGVTPVYEEMPAGVLGFTRFGAKGVEEVVVSRSLSEESSIAGQRRVNTTLAHEAGHGLLHAHLFTLATFNPSLFSDDDASPGKVLCRDEPGEHSVERRQYDGRWWELQANMLMGALLLPRALVHECVGDNMVTEGRLGVSVLPPERREGTVRLLAQVFDVNPVVARIRLTKLYPVRSETQLSF